jgi:hypothetical protein
MNSDFSGTLRQSSRHLRDQLAMLSAQNERLAQMRGGEPEGEPASVTSLRRAWADIPLERLQRLAEGRGTPEDWRVTDQLMARDGQSLGGRRTQQAYGQMAAQVAGEAQRRHPAPVQDIAWHIQRERTAPVPPWMEREDAIPPAPQPPGSSPRRHGSRRLLAACAVALAGGIALELTHTNDTAPGAAGPIILGILLILAAVATPVIAVLIVIGQEASKSHRAWLAAHPPSQRERIRRAEQAAAWTATGVAAVAMHEHHKRESARLAESAWGGPLPGKAGSGR